MKQAPQKSGLPTRRQVLQLLGSSAALAHAGCLERPRERLVPYVEHPPEVTPGIAVPYATAMVVDGFAIGLIAESHVGRPTTVRGNPGHPSSLGAASAIHLASVLQLYDEDRARVARREQSLVASAADVLADLASGRATSPPLWIVLPPQSSPVAEALATRIRARDPRARIVEHAALDRRAVYEGARLAFGRALEPRLAFERSDIVVALDADFTASMAGGVRWARELAGRRRLSSPDDDMVRLYVAEPSPTPTGSLADHRLAVQPSRVVALAAALLAEVSAGGAVRVPAAWADLGIGRDADAAARWVRAAASDLREHRGRGLVVAGEGQPAEVHALAHLVNHALGNLGRTLAFSEPIAGTLGDATMDELAASLSEDEVGTLVFVGCNPVYDAPPDLGLDALVARAGRSVCADLYETETAARCDWFVPLCHYLEGWDLARGHDGTLTVVQPLIRPLYDTAAAVEVLAACAGEAAPSAYHLVRDAARAELGGAAGAFEDRWRTALARGLVEGSGYAARAPALDVDDGLIARVEDALQEEPAGLELHVAASPSVWDGRFANNPWLQELPTPLTKVTWENAALVAPRTASRLGVDRGRVVALRAGGRSVHVPVLIHGGQAEGTITVAVGYGRDSAAERIAYGVGADVYPLWSDRRRRFVRAARAEPTSERRRLAVTQLHAREHDRPIAPYETLTGYRDDPWFTRALREPLPSMLPLPDAPPGVEQWAMTIDTSICTGCSACMIACQSENNIPVVGREGVLHGREMHWLRIDTYVEGEGDDAVIVHQPMACQHCEMAPCEYVCPVNATVHSPDGLNEMVYNRCVGTRFCSNNCPYKVRRFNWFEYNDEQSTTRALQYNPNVTVRARGVMEKCTYCVQRIRRAEIDARMENRAIAPGEVATACQQACPTGAIRFGSLTHAESDVVRWRAQPRAYYVLHDLGTRPRTAYLAKITNPRAEEG